MLPRKICLVSALLCTAVPSLASAQRFPFERSFEASGLTALEVSTLRGKVDVVAGGSDRVVVSGAATVRVGWNVPPNAVDLARQVAAMPPIERDGATLWLRSPSDASVERAVTVSYQVRVPAATRVRVTSDSGAVMLRGIAAPVDVRTQSSAIDVDSLNGAVTITTGSGAVAANRVAGSLMITTSSSAIAASGLNASLRVRTQSGEVNAGFDGPGDVDVETGSSAIRLDGVNGGLSARTQSGRVTVRGAPRRGWTATTGSGALDLTIDGNMPFSVDALTESGSVDVTGAAVHGSVAKREVKGAIDGGGELVRIASRSGSIRLHVAR